MGLMALEDSLSLAVELKARAYLMLVEKEREIQRRRNVSKAKKETFEKKLLEEGVKFQFGKLIGFERWATSPNIYRTFEARNYADRSPVLCFDVSNDGKVLLTASKKGELCLWDVTNGRCAVKYTDVHGGPCYGCGLRLDFKLLKQVKDVQTKSSKKGADASKENDNLNNNELDINKMFASCSSDTTIKLFSLRDEDIAEFIPEKKKESENDQKNKRKYKRVGPKSRANEREAEAARAADPMAALEGKIKLKEEKVGGPHAMLLKGHEDTVKCVALSSDGLVALTCSSDGVMRRWCLRSGKCTFIYKGYLGGVSTCCFSPDNSKIVSGGDSDDPSLRMWDAHIEQRKSLNGVNGTGAYGQEGSDKNFESNFVHLEVCFLTFTLFSFQKRRAKSKINVKIIKMYYIYMCKLPSY